MRKLKRFPHEIKNLKGDLGTLNLIFIDTETKEIKETAVDITLKFKLATANFLVVRNDGRVTRTGNLQTYSEEELFNWIINKLQTKRKTYIISANIWFDIRVSNLLHNFMMNGFKIKTFHSKAMTTIIDLDKGKYNVLFINMQQIVPVSVKKMGETIGLAKIEVDLKNITDTKLMNYCQRDTDIITKMFLHWLSFIRENSLGKFGVTIASQAMIAYRRRFISQPIYVHALDKITKLERDSYYGGRTEIFYYGKLDKGIIYNVDVNSMYPYIMFTKKLPYDLYRVMYNPQLKDLIHYIQRYFVIAKVWLNTDKPFYPKRYNDKLCFPIGKFTTTLCKGELEIAIRNCHIVYMDYMIIYKEDYIFKEYIDFFHKLKTKHSKDKDKVGKFLDKILMNSLYGKFGQKMSQRVHNELVEDIQYKTEYELDIDTKQRYKRTQLGNRVIVYKDDVLDAFNTFVAVSAGVTSYARVHLLNIMLKAKWGNFYYSDTDSLFINQKGFDNIQDLLIDNKLGMLEVQGKSSNVIIYAPKDYTFGKKVKIKGIPKRHKIDKEGDYHMIQFPNMRSDLTGGMNSEYQLIKMKKTLSRRYTKGIVDESGNVTPFILSEF